MSNSPDNTVICAWCGRQGRQLASRRSGYPSCSADARCSPGSKVIVSTGRLELHGDLDVDARTAFIAQATEAIASADTGGTKAELDCSAVAADGPVDAATIGMLVTLARTAQRRGARIVLVRAPKTLRAQLESVDAAHFFNYRG
jgi:ABC-type transporter Mla MlaB component